MRSTPRRNAGPQRLGRRAAGATRRLRWAIEDRRLVAEQRRAVLGPAHLKWTANDAAINERVWSDWDWSRGGHEWSASPDWEESLVHDVLERWIPSDGVVLEVGPGAGRWSERLVDRRSRLILVDVSEKPLQLCRERFAQRTNVDYVLSPGGGFSGVADTSVSGVWSFDVFVHVAPRDQALYLDEIARVLIPDGVAVIHHADGRNRGVMPSRAGWRAPMSRGLFAALAQERGLRVERQLDSWGPDHRYDLGGYADVITVCRKPGHRSS